MSLTSRTSWAEAHATLDGRPVINGEKISLGSHRFVITHPKFETFETNFFAWYGGLDLGRIQMTRLMGRLNISANPPAQFLTVDGSELSLKLYDTAGTNLLVPTDTYHVSVSYPHWLDVRDALVSVNAQSSCNFAPRFGSLALTCNYPGATYRATSDSGDVTDSGPMPAVIGELPPGKYHLVVTYHGHDLIKDGEVQSGQTNVLDFAYRFGAAHLESQPPGAAVYSEQDQLIGKTPLTIPELEAGPARYRLELAGYENGSLTVPVVLDQTNGAATNLISVVYRQQFLSAEQDMAASDYQAALLAITNALTAKPNDADTLRLQTLAQGREYVQEAKALAGQRDNLGALAKLDAALRLLPDDPEAKNLQSIYQSREHQRLALIQQQRTQETFSDACQNIQNMNLFQDHQMYIRNKSPEQVRAGLMHACLSSAPLVTVDINESPAAGVYKMILFQEWQNPLSGCRRECLVVIGMGKNEETVVDFKVAEFQKVLTVNIGDVVSLTGPKATWIPVDPSRMQMTAAQYQQIQDGVQLMENKINAASQ